MADLNQAFLYDAFNMYYQKGMEAKAAGNVALARSQLLKASETLLKLAALSSGELKKARADRAMRLFEIASSFDGGEVRQVSKGGQTATAAKTSAPQGDDPDLTKWSAESIPDVRFEDVAGLDDVKKAITERIILPRKYPDVYKRFRKKAGGGILMYGPPGTGKTFVARATAGEVGAKFYSVKCSDILSKWFGDAEQNVRNLFETARAQEAAVIFFDEFEAIGTTRDGSDPAMQRLIPEILAQMDGFEKHEGTLLFIAATNKPWMLDSAFLRPGRFAERIYVPLPDEAARRYMLERYYRHLPVADDVDFVSLVRRTDGYSGSDIHELCEQSKQPGIMRAIEKGAGDYEFITAADITAAFDRVRPSVASGDIGRFEQFRRE